MKRIVIASALLGLMAAVPVLAHHSFAAEYDGNKPVTITGVLKSVDWRNPHIYYLVDVKDAATGKIETWTLEGYPPNMLVRRAEGWNRDKVLAKVGTQVTVTGWLARAGGPAAHSRQFTFAD